MEMTLGDILGRVDCTLLKPQSTWNEIKDICDKAVKYKTASVCIPPAYVKQVKEYVGDAMKVCTVIGFPNGYNTTKIKCEEAREAAINGADEIDMVINIGHAKEHRWGDILAEINEVKRSCDRLLKVIVETCLLSDDEIEALSKTVSESDADYIKTSTGFSESGATFHVVEIMAANVSNNTKIKAAGGIKNIEDARRFVQIGADRLGVSRVDSLM